MLSLNYDDKIWLEQYKEILQSRFPGVVKDIIVYGSKARGDVREDSDLDVLLIIKEGDWRYKLQLADAGYDLAIGTDCVPSIIILTEEEKNERIQNESVFYEFVQEEGISVS